MNCFAFLGFLFFISSLFSAPHVVIIGSPGSGKGTCSHFLTRNGDFEQVNPGALLRKEVQAESEIGRAIQEKVGRGELISNEIVWGLVHQSILQVVVRGKGVVLDAFPASNENYQSLKEYIAIHPEHHFIFVVLSAPFEVCVKRMSSRLICGRCGDVYNEESFQPSQFHICDRCGGLLSKRQDDTIENATKRVQKSLERIERVFETIVKDDFKVLKIDTDCSIQECIQKYGEIHESIPR